MNIQTLLIPKPADSVPSERYHGRPIRPLTPDAYQPEVLRVTVQPSLVPHEIDSPRRGEVEAFVGDVFARHFSARLTTFMPLLVALHDRADCIAAVVGFRSAASETLFLEQYTRQPIERMLKLRLGATVRRERIVEVGSFACRDGRAALTMVRMLIPYLIACDYSWVVFTAADTLLNVFGRLQLAPKALCTADRKLLRDEHNDWGNYYEHAPVVMAGRLSDGAHAAARAGSMPTSSES